MEDLQYRIAPEPPTRKGSSKTDRILARIELDAYNLKHNPQIDWTFFIKKKPKHGEKIYCDDGDEIYSFLWYSTCDTDDNEKWCYAKEYEEAEAIKKSIRPFGDGWKEVTSPIAKTQNCREWEKGKMEIVLHGKSRRDYTFSNEGLRIITVHESIAEEHIQLAIKRL